MTLADRVVAFAAAYPKWAAAWPCLSTESGRAAIYATWCLGNDYRNKTQYYGAYPPGYLARMMALFPECARGCQSDVLHVFSGSLPAGHYKRCDLVQPAELGCSVYDLPKHLVHFPRLVFADPPYTSADAVKYGTPMVDRRRALAALAQVTDQGAYLVWLDTVWPMHRKTEWATVGRITIVRSTNHRVRMATIFERQAA
jgi:hypothetical protein